MSFYIRNNKLLGSKVFYKPVEGPINTSLIKNHINTSTQTKLTGKNSSTDKLIYSTQDPYYNDLGNFIRNSSCWLNGVTNISCFSPAQLGGGGWQQRGGTLITKKHVLFSKHYKPTILSGGTPIIFVDDNNNVVRRNLTQLIDDNVTDISIGLLDSEVPNNIKIAKVLPKNYATYLDLTFNAPNPILCVGLDQEEKALVKEFQGLQTVGYYEGDVLITYLRISVVNISSTSIYNSYIGFTETIVGGDSGNPIFLIINNELVILATWTTATTGAFITGKYDIANSIIESLSPGQGYALTSINLASFYSTLV